jgi:hypothetical protein
MPKKSRISLTDWLEKILLSVVLGGVSPIGFLLFGWWGTYLLGPEDSIPFFAFFGLGLGLLVDLRFLRRWIESAYRFHPIVLVAIYLFYSVGMFGFFMGVPVFNTIWGPLAGFYTGRRVKLQYSNPGKTIIHRVSLFTAFVLAVACLASLLLAASETTLAANINGMLVDMLGLKISFNNQTILLLSLIAGTVLVILEYYLTRAAARFALNQ